MTPARTAAFLFAFASLGSLAAATASRFTAAFLAAAVALAVSVTFWRFLERREAREAMARIEVLGQPYRDVLEMASGRVVRRAYVRTAPGGETAATTRRAA